MPAGNEASTVLIVDDTPSNLQLVVGMLESRGYRVLVAQDGEEGLRRARYVLPDLILLDVMMPGADGFEICRCLKACDDTRNIPVIFMTALAETEQKVKGFEAGAVDYVTKPLQFAEVMARVDTHLKLHAAQRQLEMQNEELERRVEARAAQLIEGNRLLQAEIVAHKQAQERLALVDFALNQVSEAAYMMDEHARFCYVNDQACRALGYDRETLLTMDAIDIDTDCSPAVWEEYWRQLKQHGSLSLERRHRTRNGDLIPVEVNANYFEYRGVAYNLALVRDIGERKRLEAQEEIRRQIFEALAQGGELPDILNLVIGYVEQVSPDCLGSIMLLDRDGKQLKSLASPNLPDDYTAAIDGIAIGDGAGSCGTAVWRRETVIAEDVRTHPYWQAYKHLAERFGFLACWSEPIFSSAGEVLGTFGIYRRHAGKPSQDDLELLRRASHFAAIAIERKQIEAKLMASEREFRTLAENSPDVIVRYDRDCRCVYFNRGWPKLFPDGAENSLGNTSDEFGWMLSPSPEAYIQRLRWVMQSGEADEMVLECKDRLGQLLYYILSMVPERHENGDIGSVLAIGHDITELKKTERRLKESRAQLRQLTAKREQAREEERKHIAREIHDELGQLLSVLRLHLTTLDFRLGDDNPDIRDRAQKMVATVDKAIQIIRNLATRLRPAVLNAGILTALEWLVQEFAESTGIDCRLRVFSEDISLDEDRAMTVFRIVQESLTNVLRHAAATRVDISIRDDDGICEVKISDNGKGFDPGRAKKAQSSGIVGMRERALMLRGALDIASAEGGGTVVRLRIPMADNAFG